MKELAKEEAAERVAKNAARLFNDVENPFVLNLGVGIPSQVSNFITNDNIFIQTENGMLGAGRLAKPGEEHPMLINASRRSVIETKGCVYLDSCLAFGMIRGGRVDATVLGAMQVDEKGNIANWTVPGGNQLGVGGAMDLISGANKVVIAMIHTNKGRPKLVRQCSLPVTGFAEADIVITEMAVFEFKNNGFLLTKIAPDAQLSDIESLTEFAFAVANPLEIMLA
ncbi:MAG: succinyl-CoA--3-ketoacid-CoA transferase [Gracilibacteraceae bacterium]|nr:succinyl-CoA--3-ketoacid-CoA transferase [Gracilibacteraceae bacterium]